MLTMSYFRSTALASVLALAAVGFSGHLATAGAQPANTPKAKTYAETTNSQLSFGVTQTETAKQAQQNPWQASTMSSVPYACDLRCRTGFVGYR
jgi:hypothetical protein